MALNFPDSPSLNQVYTDTTSGFSYQWDGVVWKSFAPASSSQIRIIDDISGSFNGSTQTFALTSTGTAIIPGNAQQLRVVLGGIVQEPLTDYTVSGSNITFTTAPGALLDCSIVSLGPAVPVNTIEDGTVTPPKLSTGGPTWNTSGDVYISGIASVGTAITMYASSGIVSATAFYGDGANLSNTGSTLSAASGTERLVFTSLTSGTMTASSTDANVTYNATTQTLSAPNVSIAGTLTYEDVTNVDSIGIITARSGIDVTSGDVNIISGNLSVNTNSTPTNLYVSGNAASNIVGLGTTDANTTLNFAQGNNFSLELTGSIVLENPTGITTGQSGIILIQQDGIGSRTVGFSSYWDFPSATAPTLSTGANALDVLTYFVRNSTSIVTNSLIGIGTL